ncbi:DMT family transporter [Pseudokineococcus lusitanus]|uniref:Putative membrane protein n=1 Tax=Pseudokineococcus lusitanus TaxID=763993 RepID=A0A3N1G8S5_9ACTN|nr:DMT family transporter [Pseudokineococcus lusitanus]ROP26614.1 putative membrane protein [Pseudokineococcus lusitanus]
MTRNSWIPYAAGLVLFWGVWGATSGLPTARYGYPDEMVYVIWAFTMLVPAAVVLRRTTWDRRGVATGYGLVVGLTGAGGQLLLFKALTLGPAYLVFPLVALSPAITVLLALVLLRERLNRLSAAGVVMALVAVVLFSVSSGDGQGGSVAAWLPLAALVTVAWGVQAFVMRLAAVQGVNDGTTFGWMTISGLLLVPLALVMAGGLPSGVGWEAPTLAGGTQLLNAVGALFLVMALSRGKASVVAPVTNALAPVLTIVLSLLLFRTLPSVPATVGIVLALVGSTLMVRSDERRGEALAASHVPEARRRTATGADPAGRG